MITLSGILMLVKPELENTLSPILVMLFGMLTLAKSLQLQNALFQMAVTLSGILTLVRFLQL